MSKGKRAFPSDTPLIRRGGGSPREVAPGERVPMSFRVTPELKGLMDRASRDSGRSVAAEIEFRLERSFERQDLLADALELAYGRDIAAILLILIREFVHNGRLGADVSRTDRTPQQAQNLGLEQRELELSRTENWQLNPDGYEWALQAAIAVIEQFRPEGNLFPHGGGRSAAAEIKESAREVVSWTMAAIKNGHAPRGRGSTPNPQYDRFVAKAREMLGPELLARVPQ
jgi:hypothetical protein